ncbi:MAG TPA: mechanosensitive ion channel protein MscS [Cytophagales bacterium]|nr:mechanosensitive ion channel protein MscS [Cytophagales bacterium]HAA18095.1 mechanosensitive ion channel protein MscS [Cytophagales bacterium]HAP59880.1 mechanosensitive ion channel protein MscS [Cytophagales bacterium]
MIEWFTTGSAVADYSLLIVGIGLIAVLLARILRFFLVRFLRNSSGILQVDPTRYSFLKNAISFLVFLAALIVVFYTIPSLRQFGVTLFAGAGILAAIIGFASQAAFSNIVAGIFIIIFRPFRVGDTLMISQQYFGIVEDINLRHTTIRDIENKRFIIPNSLISSEVIHNFNIEDPKVANQIYFSVSYTTNLDQAIAFIQDEAAKHPSLLDNRSAEEIVKGQPVVRVRVMEWAQSSIQLRATVWAQDPDTAFDLKTDLLKSVKERFDREGIEIPYPYQNVVIKSPSE